MTNRMRGTFMRPDGSTFSMVAYCEGGRYAPEGSAWVALGDKLAAATKRETSTPGYYFKTIGVQFNDEPWSWMKVA